jgi:hypothetical protein
MAITVGILSEFKPQGIDKAIKEFQQLEGAGAKAGFAIRKAALPAAAALGALTVAAKKFIDAGEAASSANARIDQINESMGLFGEQADAVTQRLIKYAEATGRATGIDNLAIKATQAKLLTFAELAQTADVAGGAFDRATQAAIDLAAAGFGTAEGNAVQLGKALNDPIKGIAALAKSGVTFTKQEKDKIKTLVESNRTLEAQELILAAIEKQVGGTALATADDTAKMKEAFAQASQQIGLALLPFLSELVPILQKVAQFAADNKDIFVAVGFAVAGLAASILALNAAMKVYKAIQTVVTIATAAFNAVLAANPITLVVIAIAALVAGLIIAYNKFEGFRNLVDTVFNAIRTAVSVTVGFVRQNWDVILAILTGPIGAVILIWRRFGDDIKEIFRGVATAIRNAFEGAQRIIKGVINFIIRGWNKIEFKVPGFKIGPIGYDGFTLGLPKIPELAKGGIVSSPTLALIGEAGPEAVVPLDRYNGGPGGVNITVTGALDPVSVAQQIRKLLNDDATRSGRTAFV